MHQSAAALRTRTEQRGRDGLKNLYQSIGRRYPNKIKHTKKCIYSGRLKENISQHQNQAEACAVVVVVGEGGFNIENQVRERGCVGAQQKIPIENMGGFRVAHPICTQGTCRSKTTQGG